MASPRPVPCIRLTRESSARSKGRNSFFLNSSDIPMPSSATTNSKHPTPLSLESFSSKVTVICPLSWVYFTAFDSRLRRICLIRTGSPYTEGCSTSFMLTDKWCLFPSISGLMICETSLRTSLRQKASSLRLTFPDSILDISSTSLISSSKCAPESWIFFRQSAVFFSSPSVFSAMAVIPRMAFIGVLISWLILDKKSDLA